MTHPFAHPSGPSNVARDSSVKRTYFMSDFMYFLAQLRRNSLCLDEGGGLLCEAFMFRYSAQYPVSRGFRDAC